MKKEFTMSMYVSTEALHKDKAEYFETLSKQLYEVLKSYDSVHNIDQWERSRKDLIAQVKDQFDTPEYAWECNQCGSQEYTMALSEDDVHSLGCSKCGGDEWHKSIKS